MSRVWTFVNRWDFFGGDWRERPPKSIGFSITLSLPATLTSSGPACCLLAPFCGRDTLSDILSPLADALGVGCHTQAPLRSWLCCHGGIPVARICDCEVFSLFNVVGYSRFSKSVFFPCDPLPVTCCPHPTPVKKRTSICKAVDTIREAFCNGF